LTKETTEAVSGDGARAAREVLRYLAPWDVPCIGNAEAEDIGTIGEDEGGASTSFVLVGRGLGE